jgi:predicted RNA-binding Zn-ribbon protein involved in translation (DUF1610 family)
MGKAADWLREERRRTLGDWVAVCVECGHGARYVAEREAELERACPQCGAELRSRCPACGARFASMFAVTCERCGAELRPREQFGVRVARS